MSKREADKPIYADDTVKHLDTPGVREAISEISDSIGRQFIWSETRQGHDYWAGVTANLRALANYKKEKRCGCCGQVLPRA